MGGVKKSDKAITLEDFISKSVKKYENRLKIANIEVDGDLIPFSRPSDEALLSYIDGIAKAVKFDVDGSYQGQDTSLMLEESKEFVYDTCKFLHSKELQQSFECIEPTDIVVKVFGIEGTIDIAQKVKEAFDCQSVSESVDKTIKN